jgi:hypothetical protein
MDIMDNMELEDNKESKKREKGEKREETEETEETEERGHDNNTIKNENIQFVQEEDDINSLISTNREIQNTPLSPTSNQLRRGESMACYQYTPSRPASHYYIPPEESSETNSDISNNNTHKKDNELFTYKKYTYKELEKEIHDDYFDEGEYHSSALDILATYLKGQKLIYMESKAYCENRLNYLMMPSILLSTAATVLSSIVKDFY